MNKIIEVPKRKLKGEDGHKTFSVRVPNEIYEELIKLTHQTELSRNEVVTILLKEALKIAEIKDED
ncbi:MAG: CopG family transcriptional regulator [Anaerovoracaceae bacterium]